MTDAAVIADSGPVPDAPVDSGAAINENAAAPTSPLGSQIPPEATAKAAEPKAPATLDDSIDRAIAKSAAKEAPKADVKAQPVAKEPVKADQPRENGKFVAKDALKAPVADSAVAVDSAKPAEAVKPSFTASEAPARFSDDAKKEWATAPESVRREAERAIKELTEGHAKYRTAAERDSTLNEFHEMAKASGKDLPNVVREYVNMENLLRKDPVAGIEQILQRVGISPRQYAEHILNQTPDEQASKSDATIRELRNELAALKETVGGVTKTFEQQQTNATKAEVEKFAADHPRFEELADDIAFFLQTRTKDLSEAYELASRLNPAPAQATAVAEAASSAAIDPAPQPDAGRKSINGAPTSGLTSLTGKKRTSQSIDEALSRAFSSVG